MPAVFCSHMAMCGSGFVLEKGAADHLEKNKKGLWVQVTEFLQGKQPLDSGAVSPDKRKPGFLRCQGSDSSQSLRWQMSGDL